MAIGRTVAILAWLLALAVFGVRAESAAGTAALDDREHVDLSAAVYRLEDPGGTLAIEQVSQRGAEFRPGEPQIGFSASAWWLRIPVQNNSSRVTWWLDSGTRTAHELDVYVADGAGSYQRQSASSNRAFADRPLPTGNFVFPVTLPAGQTTVIYLRARSTGWIGLSLSP